MYSLQVTFHYFPQSEAVTRVFLPGQFNDWGPNAGGRIATAAPSQMEWVADGGYWRYPVILTPGETYEYKVHLHYDDSGAQNT